MTAAPLAPETGAVPVAGGQLHVARFGDGEQVVLGLHGVTANSMSLAPVARHLESRFCLLAPDLRGRGASAALPGPFGMRAHAEDGAAVIRASSEAPVAVVGESMGAYVAVVLAAEFPELVSRLVLVDGGLPLPLPPGLPADLDAGTVAKMVLGPALERLSTRFASLEDYLAFWRAHPAFARDWNVDIEAYLAYDLEPAGDAFCSRVSKEAVLEDSVDLFHDEQLISEALSSLEMPVALLRAPRNLLDQPAPLIPQAVADDWERRLPNLSSELVEDVNHYSLMLGDRGASLIAALVAA